MHTLQQVVHRGVEEGCIFIRFDLMRSLRLPEGDEP
jgi:hypothetical protein